MRPGDIVLVRFPQADLQAGKLRPALVVATGPGRFGDVLLALITSRTHQAVPDFDEIIDPSADDYAETGLKARSVVRVARLITVEPRIVSARLGAVSSERLERIRARLIAWLQE